MSATETDTLEEPRGLLWGLGVFTIIVIVGLFALGSYWSYEPDNFDVREAALVRAEENNINQLPNGYVFANTLAHIAETLLYKSGGYITNDVSPPGILLDNIPAWEYGALIMLRDASSALRNHLSRNKSQSAEDPDLAKAEPYFYYERNSWALPPTEAEYIKGIVALHSYMERLKDPAASNPGQFYSRADNLWQYVEIIIKRLGGLSTRLGASTDRYEASIAETNTDMDLGEEDSMRAIPRTPWLEIDDVFWEARGAAWALLHILKAVKYDFREILKDKRATDTVDLMIHEMESALSPMMSPVILDGNGYGMFANYSLTMANYIARANGAALDLRDIMNRG